MSPQAQLEHALAHWHRLATEEADAIRRRDWVWLATCQAALKNLQVEITRGLAALGQNGTAHPGAERFPGEQRLRARAAELLRLEQDNAGLLQAAREAALAEASRFQQATHTLRRLRASYAPHPPAAWVSYS